MLPNIERRAYVLTDDNCFIAFDDNGYPVHTSYRHAQYFEDTEFGLKTARSHLPRIPTAQVLKVTFQFEPIGDQ